MAIEIPQGELFVSHCSYDGVHLSARLIVEDYTESIGSESVLCIHAKGVPDVAEAAGFLKARKDSGEAVYVGSTEAGISVESEYGETIFIQGADIALSFDTLNADELRETLARVYHWYQSTNTALANARTRINRAHNLIAEQTRRIEVKAANKAEGSTAATLYSQQLQLLHRVLTTLMSAE